MGNCFPRLGAHGDDSRGLQEGAPQHMRRDPRHSSALPMQQERYNTRKGAPGDKQASGTGKDIRCLVEGGGGKGGAVRVKIVLTKEAAARLLACSGGSTEKMLAHVAGELRKMDSGGDAGLGARHDRWRPALEAIPETPREA